MPHVEHDANLALIMYRPEPTPTILDLIGSTQFEDKDVSLFWQNTAYDEVVENGNWLLGRQNENYVAVRRSCTEQQNSWWACPMNQGQTWVIMVGDSSLYGNFTNFQQLINEAQFVEDWYFDPTTNESYYYAKIEVDTFSLDYAWGRDYSLTPINTIVEDNALFKVYPNPTQSQITLAFNAPLHEAVPIQVYDLQGKLIHYQEHPAFDSSEITINT